MNRAKYFEYIDWKLSQLCTSIEKQGSVNILNLHLHSENFYLHFFNLLFDWNLENLNTKQHNVAGIDLIDTSKKIIVQVSSTATRQKILSALKNDLSHYMGYSFKFISISKDAEHLRTKSYNNLHNLKFSPAEDIIDVTVILGIILAMNIDRQKDICEFIKKELKSEPNPDKIESSLATIINILSKEDWNQGVSEYEKIPYDIGEKIPYNKIKTARYLIDDYKIHYHRIDKIYSEFDKQGANKSLSILSRVRGIYYNIIELDKVVTPDECFLKIIEQVVQKIQESANFVPMPEEELMLCVQILVVDAFIRCKIFENPSGGTNANS